MAMGAQWQFTWPFKPWQTWSGGSLRTNTWMAVQFSTPLYHLESLQALEDLTLKQLSSHQQQELMNHLYWTWPIPLRRKVRGNLLSPHISPQDFPSFPGNLKICVVQTTQILQPYSQSGEDKEVAYFLKATCVLYSTYKAISSQSLSWWLSKALRLAGIELGYTSHSTRGASISAATAAGLSVELIFEAADWASAQTFKRFYHREQSSGSFSRAVLKSWTDFWFCCISETLVIVVWAWFIVQHAS